MERIRSPKKISFVTQKMIRARGFPKWGQNISVLVLVEPT